MNKTKNPVVAIGMDAAEPSLLEDWMSQGYLKNLSRLREQGVYGRLQNFDDSNVETAWTTFSTGCSPEKTGFWSLMEFREGTYEVNTRAAYDFKEYPPFYALGEDYRVAAFDVPQVRLNPKINGIQVGGWGAHSPQVPSTSLPESLFEELLEKHGGSPTLHNDYPLCLNFKQVLELEEKLKIGMVRRAAICRDLLERENWDLFLTVFNDPHSAGHACWHLSQPDHPLYEAFQARISHDPLLAVYQAMDDAIGKILEKAPENAYIVIFSAHGMGSATIDLPSFVYLPEFMYRFNFPGQWRLAHGDISKPLPPPFSQMKWNYWERHLWGEKFETNPIRRFLRKETPTRIFKILEPYLDLTEQPDLVSHYELRRRGEKVVPWNPAQWYKPLWPSMKAFAIPSFAEGYIRINLQGREPQGKVAPSEYHGLCDQICDQLYALKEPRQGIPMVKKIIRTRTDPSDSNPKLPEADLIVVWQHEYAPDVMDSPDYGRFGPLPHYRAGSHREQGLILAVGPDIKPNTTISSGHVLDLAPSLLSLMDAPIPQYFEGKPLHLLTSN